MPYATTSSNSSARTGPDRGRDRLSQKGIGSAGVQRQYTGTAGRIENSQIGVFLAYTTARGRALADRRLYLPEHSWLADPERCRSAGVPEGATFATKPALAAAMIAAALDAGLSARWVSGDEVYSQDPRLRGLLEQRGIGYVLAIAGNRRVNLDGTELSVADIAVGVSDRHWHRYRAGQGAKGQVGLDHYQVRGWRAWHRHITLAMLALAFLAALAALQPARDEEHMPLTVPEIRRLLAVLVLTRYPTTWQILHWSRWRRCHQAIARRCHYQRRSQPSSRMSLEH